MNIFNLKDIDEHISDKINLDDLYEKKRETDEVKLQLYNRILNRIHERIKLTSRQRQHEQFCWYAIPEIMVGIPKYNSIECTSYLLDKLDANGFKVKYTHPNLIFISWNHHVPSYVRNEFKKKTGIVIDNKGDRVDNSIDNSITLSSNNNNNNKEEDMNQLMFNTRNKIVSTTQKKVFTSVDKYKPNGNFIYNTDLFATLGDKLKKP
jgi:hypothetical protein